MNATLRTLTRNVRDFSFVERETVNGTYVRNRCGRDFLYYALHYYYPVEFNAIQNSPREIDRKRLFGIPVPASLAWTQVQFVHLSAVLTAYGVLLYVNGRRITSFRLFVSAMLFSRCTYESAIALVEESVANDHVCGIDISLGWWGLLDHVVFVYGYDGLYLYVIDTHIVPGLEYEQQSGMPYCFRLPKEVVKKRWSRFGRVWQVIMEAA